MEAASVTHSQALGGAHGVQLREGGGNHISKCIQNHY